MKWWWLAAVAVACGGDDTLETDTTDTDTDTDTEVPTCQVPSYDLPTLTCDQLINALDDTVGPNDFCTVKEDCVVLRAECEHWASVNCYYLANGTCLGTAEMAAFNAAASDCGTANVCQCTSEPAYDCVNGSCQFL